MEKGKLLPILKTFSTAEMKKFGDFVASPYFNTNPTLKTFFNILKKNYPDFDSKNFKKEKLFSKLFPGNKYNEQVYKNLTSDMIRLCKEFLQLESFKLNVYENKLNLVSEFSKRKLDSIYKTEIALIESDLEKQIQLEESIFSYLYKLEDIKTGFHLERNEQMLVIDKVRKSGEYLILYFLHHLTRTAANIIVNRTTFNVEQESNLVETFFDNLNLDNVIKYMKDKKISHYEIVEMNYYRIQCMLKPEEESYYFRFKHLVYGLMSALEREETYGLFTSLESYCAQQINRGNKQFVKELFEIFKKEIFHGIYKYNEDSPVTFMKFRNTYLTALRAREFGWTESFIENFKGDLVEEDRTNILHLAYAQLSFEKKEFEKVLAYLSKVKTDHIYIKVDVRNIMIMTYFELKFTEEVISMIDAYRHFLTDNAQLTREYRENNLRFVNALNALILAAEKMNKYDLLLLKEKLTGSIGDRKIEWLVDKIEKLV